MVGSQWSIGLFEVSSQLIISTFFRIDEFKIFLRGSFVGVVGEISSDLPNRPRAALPRTRIISLMNFMGLSDCE